MVSQTGKKPPCGNTLAGRLPGRLHRKPGLSNRMPDPRKTILSAARNFLGARRARRNTRRCARKNTCRRALSERCTSHAPQKRRPPRVPETPAGIHAGAHAKIPVAAPYRNAAQPSAAKTPSAARARNARRTPARHRDTPAEMSARNTARKTCSGILHPAPKHSAGLQSRITHKTSPSY